jgi:hypothetical protein
MVKGSLCDKGESGSERRAKSQRHVVNELACYLSVYVVLVYDVSDRLKIIAQPVKELIDYSCGLGPVVGSF